MSVRRNDFDINAGYAFVKEQQMKNKIKFKGN